MSGKKFIKSTIEEIKRKREEETVEAYVEYVSCPQCKKRPVIVKITISGRKTTITIKCSCGYEKNLTEVKDDFSKHDWKNFTDGVEEILQREFFLRNREIDSFWRRYLMDALMGIS